MLEIQDTLVSLDLFSQHFCCDLSVCKGCCCVEGDAGNYWCEATKDDCSTVSNASAYTVTVAPAKTVADLVAITDDWTFTPSATIASGTMAESDKLFGAGGDGECDYNKGMRVKENRALAFKLNSGAKVKVTFTEKSDSGTPREMQLGTAASDDDNKAYGHSGSSPAIFDVYPLLRDSVLPLS